jgi:hypothetical protein
VPTLVLPLRATWPQAKANNAEATAVLTAALGTTVTAPGQGPLRLQVRPAQAGRHLRACCTCTAHTRRSWHAHASPPRCHDTPWPTCPRPLPRAPPRPQVNGFPPGLGEEQLKQIFDPFGTIDRVELVKDQTGNPVGYGYVTFRTLQEGAVRGCGGRGRVAAV